MSKKNKFPSYDILDSGKKQKCNINFIGIKSFSFCALLDY